MANLNTLLKRATNEYASRKAAAEAQVVRWEYWSGPAYDPKPLYFERMRRGNVIKRGERIDKPNPRGCAYGFDSRDRVVIDRQPRSDEPAFDEFFTYSTSGIESAAYARNEPHALHYVTRQLHRGGKPVSTDVLDAAPGSSYSETYTYRDGRLSAISVISVAGPDKNRVRYDVIYDSRGRFLSVRRYFDSIGIFFPIYVSVAPGETLDSLAAAMQDRLVDLIPKALAKAKIREPAYCLAIAYDVANDELPPVLGVGLDSQRQRWLSTRSRDAKSLMWNPKRLAHFKDPSLKLFAPGLEDESQKLIQFVLMKEALWIPRRLLNAVAMRLNQRSWKGILPTTDDFIVYAVDFDGDDLKKNLKEGVPPAKIKLLRSRRLL